MKTTCESLIERLDNCKEAVSMIYLMESELFASKILSPSHKYNALPEIERLLYEFASDPFLTRGVFYSMTISTIVCEKGRKMSSKTF